VAMPVATHLRPLAATLFFVSALFLAVGWWRYGRVRRTQREVSQLGSRAREPEYRTAVKNG